MGSDTSVKKVMAKSGPRGDQEQTYLVSGKRLSLRLWEKRKPLEPRSPQSAATRPQDM